jgi:hypothetical protein
LTFVDLGIICSEATVVFAYDDFYHFSLLQSSFHEIWLRRNSSSLGTSNRYTPSDSFQTFPFPESNKTDLADCATQTGRNYYQCRYDISENQSTNLSTIHNLLNLKDCQDPSIRILRSLQIELDKSILKCYGWEDIDLEHDFYANDRKKIRFTPSPAAQREIFTRLIALNQEIAAQEAAQGLVVEAGEEN